MDTPTLDFRLLTGCTHALHETCTQCSCPCCGTRAVRVASTAAGEPRKEFWMQAEAALHAANWEEKP